MNSESINQKTKRVYHSPKLSEFGNIRTMTLGGSPGAGDTGGVPQKPIGMTG